MAIQPIDLQTLLVRLAEVGKEQGAQKAAAAQSQAVAGSEIARRSEQEARSVTETHTMQEGPENVGDEEGQEAQEREGKRRDDKQDAYSREDDIFRDPDLGQNVDVTG